MAGEASPTYVLASLEQLLQPYAAPVPDADGWRCGAARVTHTVDGLHVERGSGTPIEVVRAGLAALLRLRDERSHRDQLCRDAEALDRLLDESPPTPPTVDPVA